MVPPIEDFCGYAVQHLNAVPCVESLNFFRVQEGLVVFNLHIDDVLLTGQATAIEKFLQGVRSGVRLMWSICGSLEMRFGF